MKKKPIIGITLDWEDALTYSANYPWYAIRTNYASSLAQHGAAPITLPYELAAIDDYIELIDGLMITGGDYDLDPSCYGEEKQEETRIVKNNRTEFEMKLISTALAKNIPILAICAGEQLFAVMNGGTLHQDIKTYNPDALEHEQSRLNLKMHETSHQVRIDKNSLLFNIVQKEIIAVNSSHHQAVKSVGNAMKISAISPVDNIIEAVELPQYSFALGVEWHPEYQATEDDALIIKAFVEAAKNG